MASISETLSLMTKAVKEGTMNPADIPVADICYLILENEKNIFGENSIEYKNLESLSNSYISIALNKETGINFLKSMIDEAIAFESIKEKERINLPENVRPDDQFIYYLNLACDRFSNNANQAYLCLENAYYHCKSNDTKIEIKDMMDSLKESPFFCVKPVSIVIVSYNSKFLMQNCIQSIRDNCFSDSIEIIVVDNASSDGVTEWLREQPDIKLIESDTNLGFPAGCNLGVKNSKPGNDIFYLNNDTRLTPNSLFWLRMKLYESETIGATGATNNYSGDLNFVDIFFNDIEDYQKYGYINNVYSEKSSEETTFLCGFAMLIKRTAYDKTKGMDEAFTPGYFDDDDLCFQLLFKGYRLFLCHDSFIYHAGSQSFVTIDTEYLLGITERNKEYIAKKWLFDSTKNRISKDLFSFLYNENENSSILQKAFNGEPIKILELNAHLGSNYGHLAFIFDNLEYLGFEKNTNYKKASLCEANIHYEDYEDSSVFNTLQYKEYFDLIIVSLDTLDSEYKEKITAFSSSMLKKDGLFFIS